MIRAWGRIVEGFLHPWINDGLVDGVDNSVELSTGAFMNKPKATLVIPRFPRLMKKRMKK